MVFITYMFILNRAMRIVNTALKLIYRNLGIKRNTHLLYTDDRYEQ